MQIWCYWVAWVVLAGVCILVFLGTMTYFHFIGIPVYYKGRRRLDGKTIIITGANTGIGLETALDLATRGARIILACRNHERGKEAEKKIREATGNNNVVFRQVDLADLKSVRQFAAKIVREERRLDVLINNAGIAFHTDEKTKAGLDLVFTTNHFGPFLLTYLLLDLLKVSIPSRIINVSSIMHSLEMAGKEGILFDKEASDLAGYSKSKLANILHSNELSRRLEGTGVTANSLHPGVVYSDIWQNMYSDAPKWIARFFIGMFSYSFWDNRAGAQTSIYCAVDESLETVSGKYFQKCQLQEPSKFANDEEMAKKLWDISMEITGLNNHALKQPP